MDTRHSNGGRPKDLAHTEYSTDNLDLAAWLVCQGFSLQRPDPPAQDSMRRLTRFVFHGSDALSEAVATWESGQPVPDTDLRRYISTKKDLYRRARSVAAQGTGGHNGS